MDFVTRFFLFSLIILNVVIVIRILIGKQSAFSPISIFALTVVSQMFPQLYTLFTLEHNTDTSVLLYMMVACQLAFIAGYKIPQRLLGPEYYIIDFGRGGRLFFIIILACLSIIPMFYYASMESVYGGINVVLGYYRIFGSIALILCLIYLENKQIRKKWLLIMVAVIALLPLFYYAYFVKGSRQVMFMLGFILLYFLSNRLNKQYILSLLFVALFCVGSYLGASLTEIRRVNNYHEENAKELNDIDYAENFEESFEKEEIYGWDLGNAAFMIDYITTHDKYDYGASLWNGFIFNFYPQRVFGEEAKNRLYIGIDKDVAYYEDFVRRGITTLTGYYSVYKPFSVLGFLLFFLIGLFFRFLHFKSKHSVFLYMMFVLSVTYIPNMITHSTQYLLGFWEFNAIIMLPIYLFFLKYKKVN